MVKQSNNVYHTKRSLARTVIGSCELNVVLSSDCLLSCALYFTNYNFICFFFFQAVLIPLFRSKNCFPCSLQSYFGGHNRFQTACIIIFSFSFQYGRQLYQVQLSRLSVTVFQNLECIVPGSSGLQVFIEKFDLYPDVFFLLYEIFFYFSALNIFICSIYLIFSQWYTLVEFLFWTFLLCVVCYSCIYKVFFT